LEILDMANKILLLVINIAVLFTLVRWFYWFSVVVNKAATNGIQITLKGVQVTVKKE